MIFAAETEKIQKLCALRLAKDAADRADAGTIASKTSLRTPQSDERKAVTRLLSSALCHLSRVPIWSIS
jgi:hypothetical protein